MGCGVSQVGYRKSNENSTLEDVDMKLPSCKLTFSQRQLSKLNLKFSSLLNYDNLQTEKAKEKQTACLGAVVERLIQRLVCNVGSLDTRFSSKFLINLDPLKNYNHECRNSLKFKYLVRLDLISTPALYPEEFEPPVRIIEGTNDKSLPQGYAKIRVHGEFLEQWAGFLSPNGFLRRDKVQKKFLELLAKAAARPSEPFSPIQVDESKHCGSPGKIVDPITLSQILKNPASHQVFFGSAECNESRFPDPRDFRIAIVEGVPETRLHISFLSSTAQSLASDDVEISITLGIGVAGWPFHTNFPSRLPLDHVDVMLGYRSTQLDYFLVPKGPHSSIYCEDKVSVWEIRTLSTEMFLEHHYSPTSVVARVHKILMALLEILKAKGVKTINKYILKNILLYELENKKQIQHWKPKSISRRVISILGQMLVSLQNQYAPSYIFPKKNLLLLDEALDNDYISDKDILERFFKQLSDDEFKMEVNDSERTSVKDELENVLLKKWDNVIANMLPTKSNKSHRLSVVNNSPIAISYTRQQIEYVVLLIREVLKLKNIQRNAALKDTLPAKDDLKNNSDKDDFLFLLQMMFDQAKQKLLTSRRTSSDIKKTSSRKDFKLDQLLLSYDLSTAMLVDDVRRNQQIDYNFTDDLSIVIKIMECLYKAMDSDGKVLGPVLRPYLNQIFKGSHENCWFLSEWNKKADLSQFEAIGAFSELVLSKNAEPLDGILNSANKGWNWANNCLQIMEEIAKENSTKIITGEKVELTESGITLIFAPNSGKTIRVNVSIKNPLSLDYEKKSKKLGEIVLEKHASDSRYATIKSFQEVLESTISYSGAENVQEKSRIRGMAPFTNLKLKNKKEPLHVRLRDGNPFTLASIETRRQGNHRGLGSIVQALISLQKLTVLQEISQFLPEEERIRVLSDIKKLSKEVQRAAVESYKKKTFSSPSEKNRFIVKEKPSNGSSLGRISPKKISKTFTFGLKNSEPQMCGTYKSVNEFSKEKDQIQGKIKIREEQLEEKIKILMEENIRGTSRQLHKLSRSALVVSGPSGSCTLSKPAFSRRSLSFSQSVINTPFYIKVSSYGCKFRSDTLPFPNYFNR